MSKTLRFCLKTFLVFIYYILGITFFIPLFFGFVIYDFMFARRCERTEKCLKADFFDELVNVSSPFASGKNTLDGSFYYNRNVKEIKALLVFCHGIGCGRENYLNRIDYFTKKGYLVFGYDLTGCVNSGGKGLGGLPQATIDLRNALQHVACEQTLANMPIVLYGHSWSGYACAALMNEGSYNVKAIFTGSGFDSSMGVAEVFMNEHYKSFKWTLMYYFKMVERIRFGKVAKYSAIDGINKFGGAVMVAHSKDDPTIPFSASIVKSKEKCTNQNAVFISYEDRGHTMSRPVSDEICIKQSFADDPSFRKLSRKESMFKYHVDSHYDKSKLEHIYGLDIEFMDNVNKFYEKALGLDGSV